jgi:hypothetical protein
MKIFPGLSLRSNPGLDLANAFGVLVPTLNSNCTNADFCTSLWRPFCYH